MIRRMRGLAQIPLIIGLIIMAIAVPVATRLVEENQDRRGSAAGAALCSDLNSNWSCRFAQGSTVGECEEALIGVSILFVPMRP